MFVAPSESVQDYVKVIYLLGQDASEVTTSAIAERMGVSPASVTAMIKRLAEAGLVRYKRYKGVELSATGRGVALEVVRHHRLVESYLHESLGIPWDRVHQEAEVLEHFLSDELEDRMAESLGHPTHDPHGDPIPPKSGRYSEKRHEVLTESHPGPARVERVSDRDPEMLRYIDSLGLRPGAQITVEKKSPFGGPVWVKVGRKRHAIGGELASSIFVSQVTAA